MFSPKRVSDWLLNAFNEVSKDIFEPKDPSQAAGPEQPEDPENHDDPPPSKPPSSGSSSGSEKRNPGHPKETGTESKSPAKSKSTPSSGSSEFPMRDPSVSRAKAVQKESPEEEKSSASSSSSEFPSRDLNAPKGKAIKIGSREEEKSQTSSLSSDFPMRDPSVSRAKAVQKKSPEEEKSSASSSSSEFPARDPNAAKGKAIQIRSREEEKSQTSSLSSDFPMRDPSVSRRKAVQIEPPEEKSQASSSSPEFPMRDPSNSRRKAVQIEAPEKEGSQASSSSSEFRIRRPDASVTTEISLRPRQQSSPSSSGDWPPTHDPRQRQPGSLTGRRGLGIYDEEEEEEPHDQKRPRSFSPDYYWGTRHRARSPRNLGSQDTGPLLDDPDELYNASPRRNNTLSSAWSLHGQLDDPFFYRNDGGGNPNLPLNEAHFQRPGQLRVVNPIPVERHGPIEEQPDRNHSVPPFGINPLQGLQDPGGQSAEGTGVQGFMAEPPQVEIKDYFSDQSGPVRREHFNEFRAETNASISELRRVAVHAASMQWAAQRDLQQQILRAQEAEQRAQEAEQRAQEAEQRAQAAEAIASIGAGSGRRDPLEPWQPRRRAMYSPVYRAELTRHGSPISEPGNDHHALLYDNGADQVRELTVKVTLLRSRVAWQSGRRPDWQKMERMARQAGNLAEELDYQPLSARCSYYRGIAEYGQRRFVTAQASFEEAQACRGKYKEGVYLEAWGEKVAKRLQRQGEHSDVEEEEEEEGEEEEGSIRSIPSFPSFPSPKTRRRWYVKPEHPPEFDYDSGEDYEEEEGTGQGERAKVFEMDVETEVPHERRESVKQEVQRKLSKDDGSKGSRDSEGTEGGGFKHVSL
ncbi:MAG: hypothetical protein FRX48_06853 [Lasallia pustulata]|uniref:Uncharacterized protein n=1 Tax=Lasallia pustulata TaxID=136370 RepID=A0A5M8PJW8_9LECA|nr:MAG: hypothetical protein FRX48_06853 [Lasallia pustulata]